MSYNGWKNRETSLVNIWFGDTFACDAENGDGSGFVRDMLDLGAIDYDELASHYETEEEVTEDECDGMGHDLNGYGVL